jgi:hypothetical protein
MRVQEDRTHRGDLSPRSRAMHHTRVLLIAVAFMVSAQSLAAQDRSRYREYALDSSLASIIAATGADAGDVRVVHERPARIEELSWRPRIVGYGDGPVDPVRQVVFMFCDGALYQVLVDYDRFRTAGLSQADLIQALSAAYGQPAPTTARTRMTPPAGARTDSLVVARWESAESLVTLLRDASMDEFQLVIASKASGTRARAASREAIRLDDLEAPRREADQRIKDAAADRARQSKTRDANRAAFRP